MTTEVEVELLHWPHQDERRRLLAERGRPRLLLVEPTGAPPVCVDALEDWIRLPADEHDVAARADTLRRRVSATPLGPPAIDPDGVVRVGGAWAALPPVEARIMGALVDRFGTVVHRTQLADAGWPDGPPGRNALDVHVLRVRRRIAPLGLAIRTIRSRGYLLEHADGSGAVKHV